MLDRLLGGVSPAARRGITVALIVVAWAGFLVAVLAGLAAGIIVILIGFALCWFAASMLGAKSGTVPEEPAPDAAPLEPDDVQTRVRKRLESMQSKPEDEAET